MPKTKPAFTILLTLLLISILTVSCAPPIPQNTDIQTPNTENTASQQSDSAEAQEPPSTESEAANPDQEDTASGPLEMSDTGTYQDTPVGFTAEGFPYRGDPDAPITLEEYSDYLCPYCGRHVSETVPALIQQYVVEGKVQYVFRDMPLVGLHPNAPIGHKAAFCVGQQSASGYWMMHDELFNAQSQWGSVPDPAAYVTQLAENTGVDTATFETCMADSQIDTWINDSVNAGAALGFNGTPSFQFIDNQSGQTYTLVGAYPLATFTEWIDALLAGEAPPQEAQAEEEEPAELPFWANSDGLAPDPDRPGINLAGDPYRGDPDAEVVVIEFSDFQCPACQSHALLIQPILDQEFVDSGEIMWVFKNMPLQMHPQALVAATAAECAVDQDAFWQMHDLLFEQQDQWAVEEPEPALIELADTLGLDTEQFSACLASRQALERVVADLYDAQGVVSSTPTFVVLSGGRGTLLQGSREATQFVELLQGVLDSAAGEE